MSGWAAGGGAGGGGQRDKAAARQTRLQVQEAALWLRDQEDHPDHLQALEWLHSLKDAPNWLEGDDTAPAQAEAHSAPATPTEIDMEGLPLNLRSCIKLRYCGGCLLPSSFCSRDPHEERWHFKAKS